MQTDEVLHPAWFRKGSWGLGILAAIGLVGYGLTYVIAMPAVSPGGFVPTTLEDGGGGASLFAALQAGLILLYAFAFLPLTLLFTVKQSHVNPYALVFAGCLLGLSSLIEIFNNLPLLAESIYPVKLARIPPDVALYLDQVKALRYLSYDVAGFSLIYAAFLVYALVYFRVHRWLAYTILGSILVFAANVPCLWFAPGAAVFLMALSIFTLAAVPLFMARRALEMSVYPIREGEK